jgi:hypothetical protein
MTPIDLIREAELGRRLLTYWKLPPREISRIIRGWKERAKTYNACLLPKGNTADEIELRFVDEFRYDPVALVSAIMTDPVAGQRVRDEIFGGSLEVVGHHDASSTAKVTAAAEALTDADVEAALWATARTNTRISDDMSTLEVSFQRTLRIPDDGGEYQLPEGLGELPRDWQPFLNHLLQCCRSYRFCQAVIHPGKSAGFQIFRHGISRDGNDGNIWLAAVC